MSTYIQSHFHIIFAPKYRRALLDDQWRDQLHRYNTGLIQERRHKLLAINSVADHIHILIGHRPADPLPTLMRELKSNSSAWINAKGFTNRTFAWQEGYTAIGISPSHVSRVCSYIERQQEHHLKVTYHEEIVSILDTAGIVWKPEYLFTGPID